MAEHKAVLLTEFNAQDPTKGCHLRSIKTPKPAANQLLLRILCRPVNPADFEAMSGMFGVVPPKILGMEAVGVVHEVGEGVTEYHVGQKLYYVTTTQESGTWQEYALISLPCRQPHFEMLTPVPDGIPDQVAAQFLGNPWTVFALLDVLNAPRGEYVLQTAAASVLGRMFIQLARHKGIKTINLVRRNEQKEELKSIGADVVLNFMEENVVEVVRKITLGRMAYAAIDCVGGDLTEVVAASVRDSGSVYVYGLLDKSGKAVANIKDLAFRDVRLRGFSVLQYLQKRSPEEIQEIEETVMNLLVHNVLTPLVGEQFPLEEFQVAIKKSQEPGRTGKILLTSYTHI